jgi:hypothetical protein
MSFPLYGALTLLLIAVMLASKDGFLGIAFLALTLCGRSYDYEAAYGPLLAKIRGTGKSRDRAAGPSPSTRDVEAEATAPLMETKEEDRFTSNH